MIIIICFRDENVGMQLKNITNKTTSYENTPYLYLSFLIPR